MWAPVRANVSVRVRAQTGDTACLGARAAETDNAVLNLKKRKEKKIPFLERKVKAGRERRSRGGVMAGSFTSSRDWGNPRRRGFALAPRWEGAIHSGSD